MWSDLGRPPLDADALRAALLAPRGGWTRLDVVARTGSTNADLVAAAHGGAPDRSVLVAEQQEHARGRHGRRWLSPPRAGLALSVLLRAPGVTPARLGWLPLLTGVAVVDALRRVAGVRAELKWPNDVLVDGRKVGGILAEAVSLVPVPVVVVGVGVNVSLREAELPVAHATSLALCGATNTDRDPLLRAVLREMSVRERAWRGAGARAGIHGDDAGGTDPGGDGGSAAADGALAAEYRARCATLGATVRVELPGGGELRGVAVDVDGTGRIRVRTADGAVHALSAGDVTHLRPDAG